MTVLGSNRLKSCILISPKSREPNVQAISATSPLIPLLARVQPGARPRAWPGGAEHQQLPGRSALQHRHVALPKNSRAAFLLISCGQEEGIERCLLAAGQPAAPEQGTVIQGGRQSSSGQCVALPLSLRHLALQRAVRSCSCFVDLWRVSIQACALPTSCPIMWNKCRGLRLHLRVGAGVWGWCWCPAASASPRLGGMGPRQVPAT